MKKRVIWWIIIVVAVWLLVVRFTEIEPVIQALLQGNWRWVIAAVFFETLCYYLLIKLYQKTFFACGINRSLRELTPPVMGSLFINVLAPTAGMAGVLLLADDARQRGESPVKAASGSLLAWAINYGVFIIYLCAGLWSIALQHELKQYQIAAAMIFVIITVLLSSSLFLAHRSKQIIRSVLHHFQLIINRTATLLRLERPFSHGWVEKHLNEFTHAARSINSNRLLVWQAIGIALTMHAFSVLALSSLFIAFHQGLPIGIILAGYAAAVLFWVVSPTPQGIGIAEGICVLILISMAVPAGPATAIALAFRGLTFWLPLLVGLILLRSQFHPQSKSSPIVLPQK